MGSNRSETFDYMFFYFRGVFFILRLRFPRNQPVSSVCITEENNWYLGGTIFKEKYKLQGLGFYVPDFSKNCSVF